MSFTCELSGEPLQTIDGSVVVTPSGHICQRRLLLQKLESNGGKDPFEKGDASRPLNEDDLIELKIPKVMPPRSYNKSIQVTLQQLQQDYDAVLLELFDTRKLLAETREELSQALYQNDAAVRVVARMAAERDQARAAFNDWKAEGSTKRAAEEEDDPSSVTAAPTKKVKVINLPSELPSDDQKTMLDTWEVLRSSRKALQKAAAMEAPTPAQISQAKAIVVPLDQVNKEMGVTSLLTCHGQEAYVQVISDQLYQLTKADDRWTAKLYCTLSNQSPTALSTGEEKSSSIVVGFADGSVASVGGSDQNIQCIPIIDSHAIVSVSLHPDTTHLIALTAGGHIAIGRDNVWVTAYVGKCPYTAGTLHPDGLIYLAGRSDGAMDLWDFKNQKNAASLPNDGGGAVRAVSFSSNGYHVAAVYEDSMEVLVWDLRKQNVLAALNTGSEALEKVQSVTFDPAGKYLAFAGVRSGKAQVTVVTVKQWNITYSLQPPQQHDGSDGVVTNVANGIAWNKAGIAFATAENNIAANIVFSL